MPIQQPSADLKTSPKREPFRYFFERVGFEPQVHERILTPEDVQLSRTLVAGIATAIPVSEATEYKWMGLNDKINFARAFLVTPDIQSYLEKLYAIHPDQITRIAMHISEDFLLSDPRRGLAFLAVHIFLWIKISQQYLKLYEQTIQKTSPFHLDMARLRLSLVSWVPLAIYESSHLGRPEWLYPLYSMLMSLSPDFFRIKHENIKLDPVVNSLTKGHPLSWAWTKQIASLTERDPPDWLIANAEQRGELSIAPHEVKAFESLLSATGLACFSGIMKKLIGPGLRPIWYEMLRKRPLLLAEAQKSPDCPSHLLVARNPLRYSLEQVLGVPVTKIFLHLPQPLSRAHLLLLPTRPSKSYMCCSQFIESMSLLGPHHKKPG